MKISILTLFPQMFDGPFAHSIVKRAQEQNLLEITFVNIRSFGIGTHKTVDDTPYGGGRGMILRVDVAAKAIAAAKDKKYKREHVVLLDARGKTFDQTKAKELSRFDHLILVCGHYEGVDERIRAFVDEEISIGDFILTGGEIPAMLITDALTRLLPGVLKDGVTQNESFSLMDPTPLLEHPQYTKPQNFNDMSVPEVLLSGNHAEIETWRKKQSNSITQKHRPDMLKKSSRRR
ncbi:MAG TPA: tRNA (guanosine(37)-N1)-methyltransferase TrmD [Candidatus Saccharimonadales bacterium]|nr:tRNA (guanosine(37)-N1)-methyltransferase TrmD [Candidatus Saccharimonadales bacterium]